MQIKETVLTHDDFIRFLDFVKKIKSARPSMSVNEFQMLYKLMFYCALKSTEVLKLKKENFNLTEGLLNVKTSNNVPQVTTIPPIILGDLKSFLKNKQDNEYLFISKYFKKPISRQNAWEYAKDIGRLAGLNVFQITETKENEGVSLMLFKKSYKQFMSDNKAPRDLIDLKLRSRTNNRYGNFSLRDIKSFERKIFKTTFSEDEIQEYASWYKINQEIYEKLSKEVSRILDGVLKQRGIRVQDIEARAKDPEKFQQKLRDGVTYNNPTNMQDLSGIRIICFVKSDVKKVCDAIETTFEVIRMKGNEQKRNDISGYSDIQYVCKLTKARIISSEELKPYENKFFEIQVRTILQHAWSEIEHDDIYKNTANISDDLRRRFFLVSNVLESADNELDSLHHKIKDKI